MTDPSPTPGRKRWPIVTAAVVVPVVALGALWYFVLRDDAPAAVNLNTAVGSLETRATTTTTPAATTGQSSATAAPSSAVAGAWNVDTTIGSFDDYTSSYAGFRVAEELAGVGATTAIGRTPGVSGTLRIDGSTLAATNIEVDMRRIRSDDSRRDDNIQEALETGRFPTATFILTEPVDFGTVAPGQKIAVQAPGDLTVHGVTKPVVVDLEAQLVGDVVAVTGTTPVVFSDFGVTVPRAAIVLSVDDHGVIEWQLFFTRA